MLREVCYAGIIKRFVIRTGTVCDPNRWRPSNVFLLSLLGQRLTLARVANVVASTPAFSFRFHRQLHSSSSTSRKHQPSRSHVEAVKRLGLARELLQAQHVEVLAAQDVVVRGHVGLVQARRGPVLRQVPDVRLL